ncbi:hypothetical protein [Xylanimonas oleitrophica]|nr:hypothetical protein [Xylanimonas oleitrophica]
MHAYYQPVTEHQPPEPEPDDGSLFEALRAAAESGAHIVVDGHLATVGPVQRRPCGDRLGLRIGPCQTETRHQQHDDGHGTTWQRGARP